MSESEGKKNGFWGIEGRYVRPLIVFLFLSGFPLFLVDAALQYVLQLSREAHEQKEFIRLDNRLARLKQRADPEFFIRQSLRKLVKKAEQHRVPLAFIQPRIASLEKQFPHLFSFTIFDGQGRMVPRGKGEKRFLAEKLYTLLQEFQKTWKDVFSSQAKLLLPYLGCESERRFRHLVHGTGWIDCSEGLRNTWFFHHLGSGFSLFAQIHREGFPPFWGIKKNVQLPHADGINLRFIDLYSLREEGIPSRALDRTLLSVISKSEREPKTHFRVNDLLWSVLALDSRYSLLASTSDAGQLPVEKFLRGFRVFSCAMILVGGISVFFLLRRPTLPYFSVSWKLAGMFALSTGLPLLIFTLAVFTYIGQRYNALIYENWRNSGEMLRELDNKFRFAGKKCELKLREIFSRTTFDSPQGFSSFRKEMEQFNRILPTSFLSLVSSSSREIPVLEHGGREERKIMLMLLQEVMRRVSGRMEAPGEEKKLLENAEIMFDSILGERTRSFFDSSISEMGKVYFQELGFRSGFFFMDVFRGKDHVPNYLLSIIWEKEDLVRFYLGGAIPRHPLEDGSELLAVNTAPVWTALPRSSMKRGKPAFRPMIPVFPKLPLAGKSFRFVQELLKTRKLSHAMVSYRKSPYLITGIPGSNIDGYLLVLLTPMKKITDEIFILKIKTVLFLFFSLGFTFFLGWFLSEKFLHPVKELSLGIQAVRQKNFRHRIPAQDPDELGDLVIMFNDMMENLHEMTMGRVVQERLFPKKPLELGEYRVFGVSKPASQLGGDYLDYVVLQNRKLLAMLGDATGHGVPAALVMTMAKTVVSTLSKTAETPEEIFQALNQVILENMQKTLNMTMATICIDIETHEATVVNFGHPQPIFRSRQGAFRNLETSGFMLGIRKTYRVTPLTLKMEPGDRILLYTDGLAESLAQESVNGYDLFVEYVKARPFLPFEQTCQDILEHHPHVLAQVPLVDDLTVLLIERKLPEPT